MFQLDPLITKQDYEDRVLWLQRLYGNHAHSAQPRRISLNRLVYKFGGSLISVGERLQIHTHVSES